MAGSTRQRASPALGEAGITRTVREGRARVAKRVNSPQAGLQEAGTMRPREPAARRSMMVPPANNARAIVLLQSRTFPGTVTKAPKD
jgi:hypothetical protein